jgi:hypothetical protein
MEGCLSPFESSPACGPSCASFGLCLCVLFCVDFDIHAVVSAAAQSVVAAQQAPQSTVHSHAVKAPFLGALVSLHATHVTRTVYQLFVGLTVLGRPRQATGA